MQLKSVRLSFRIHSTLKFTENIKHRLCRDKAVKTHHFVLQVSQSFSQFLQFEIFCNLKIFSGDQKYKKAAQNGSPQQGRHHHGLRAGARQGLRGPPAGGRGQG